MSYHSLRRSHAKKQTGQSLVEFLVVAVALLPLFLLIPVIAKYQSIAHATQLASRYAAFDSLVRNDAQNSSKPIGQLQDEVRRRIFSNSDAPIKTLDVAGDFKANQNLFWRTPDDKPLIANFTDITVTRSQQDAYDGKTLASKPGPFIFEFGGTGIGSAHVSVKLANLPSGFKFYEPFDQINLVMNRSTSVLADGWAGKNPADVEQKFAPLAPALAVLQPLSLIVNPVMVFAEPGVTPPKLGRLDFWRDTVQADRLWSKQ
jgi:hypothetical protein